MYDASPKTYSHAGLLRAAAHTTFSNSHRFVSAFKFCKLIFSVMSAIDYSDPRGVY